jgi:replication factor C large subunit
MDLTNWVDGAEKQPAKTKSVELPWAEKYRPQKLGEVVGNSSSIEAVGKWSEQWGKGVPKKKALLLYGNVGTGKTSIAYALANENDWEVLEMNASDKRTQDIVDHIAGLGSQTRSFSGKRKLVLIEEVEGLSGLQDRGASKAIIAVIKETMTPIIITCNDIQNKNLSGMKVYCEQVGLKKVSPGSMVKRMREILDEEGIQVDDVAPLQKIADNADGDMRSAINDLQAMAQGESTLRDGSVFLEQRDRPIDVYKALQRIFRCTDYAKCRRVLWDLDEEPRNFIVWLDENIPVEYDLPLERAKAFNHLSRADMFLGRVINRQYWGFLRYVNDLMTAGVGFSKEKPHFGFTKYNFPSLIRKMGSTRGKRASEKAIAAKISPVVHTSQRRVIVDYLPLLQRVFAKNRNIGSDMASGFDLSSEELDFFS